MDRTRASEARNAGSIPAERNEVDLCRNRTKTKPPFRAVLRELGLDRGFLHKRHQSRFLSVSGIGLDVVGFDRLVYGLLRRRNKRFGLVELLFSDELLYLFDNSVDIGLAAQVENPLIRGGAQGFLG